MKEEELNKLERITIRVFLLVVLLWVSMVLYQSCSATFIKGHHNTSSSAEAVEADGDELQLMGRHKKELTPKTTTDETIKVIDTAGAVQPTDTIAGE